MKNLMIVTVFAAAFAAAPVLAGPSTLESVTIFTACSEDMEFTVEAQPAGMPFVGGTNIRIVLHDEIIAGEKILREFNVWPSNSVKGNDVLLLKVNVCLEKAGMPVPDS